MNIVKIFISLLLLFSFSTIHAVEITTDNHKTSITDKIIKENDKINLEKTFIFFANFFLDTTPESYKYIHLNYKGIEKGSDFEKALKVLVYNNKISNPIIDLKDREKTIIKANNFYKVSAKVLGTYYGERSVKLYGDKDVSYYDLKTVEESYNVLKNKELYEKNIEYNSGNKNILEQVYETILREHFDKDNIEKKELIYSAIEGLAKGAGDKYTVYFPPTKSKDFLGSLSGDFEGIGTYVDMPEPGVFILTSLIPGGPAEKAGIKGGDIVLKVDDKEITKENPSEEIISWIKGKAGTEVLLTIKRGEQVLKIKVIREKVHIKSIETEENGNSFIIRITGFNTGVSEELVKAIEELKSKSGIKKIIFDLRNNGGGYLDEVVTILNFFVPKGEAVANVKYFQDEGSYISRGLNLLNINDYDVIFLQNGGTASASEIMIGSMKDYFPNIQILGEKSFGKGSVQNIKEFYDGSSFKYTTAKWFTGKTKTGIDGVGIKPDIEIKFDEEAFQKYKTDNQMQEALRK